MKYLEDFKEGEVTTVGSYTVTEAEVLTFARAYDPQPIHTDKAFAEASAFGGLIASGWHTCAIAMRLLVDNFLDGVAAIASPGVDEIRWKKPVRPGDTLRMRWTILEVRKSRSKPDRGVLRALSEILNQDDEVVMSHIGMSMIHTRPES
jgi:acyl dehydratase